jgi:plasmid stability protein
MVLLWRHFRTSRGNFRMPVNLSVKSVPDHVAERLRRRAVRNHRSLQGELLSILTQAAETDGGLSPATLLGLVRMSNLKTPDESADIVRVDRDAH